ncbi:hypothetical protein B0H12DRAFT_849911 [Mycena haematopus]|nr:hypothetical protein B0H12DRAFT_849911 [Mycena haematopus]
MTNTFSNDRPGVAKIKRTLSVTGISVLFRTKLLKSRLTALAPIVELEEPVPGEDRDQGIAIFQTDTTGMELDKLLELWPKVQELHTLYKCNQQTTPTVEFTSLSLTEESDCVPLPSLQSRSPPLRAVSNFESWQHDTNLDDKFVMSGNTTSAQEPGCGLGLEPPSYEGCVERRTRKRSREPDVDDGRLGAKRQRKTSNQGSLSIISIVEMTVKPSPQTTIYSSVHLQAPRRTVFPGETILRVTGPGKRSLEQERTDEAADMTRYAKRQRIGLRGS